MPLVCLSSIYLLPFRTEQYSSTLFPLTSLSSRGIAYCGKAGWYSCLKILLSCRHSVLCESNQVANFFTWDSAMYAIPAQNTFFDSSITAQSTDRLGHLCSKCHDKQKSHCASRIHLYLQCHTQKKDVHPQCQKVHRLAWDICGDQERSYVISYVARKPPLMLKSRRSLNCYMCACVRTSCVWWEMKRLSFFRLCTSDCQ